MPQPLISIQYAGEHWRKFISTVLAGLFLLLILIPSGWVFIHSFLAEGVFSFSHYISAFSDPRIPGLFLRSLAMASGATLFSLAVGIPLALFLAKTSFPGRRSACFLVILPLLIPPHIHTLAWIALCGKNGYLFKLCSPLFTVDFLSSFLYSATGASMLLAFSYFPLMVLPVMAGLQGINNELEEAGSMYQSPLAVFRTITLPLITPYCFAGAVFVFIFSFFTYGVPAMLRVPSYPGEIFTRFSAMYDSGGAAALVAPVALLCCFFLFTQWRVMRGKLYTTAFSKSSRPFVLSQSPTGTGLIFLFVSTWLVLSAIVPLVALLLKAGNLTSYRLHKLLRIVGNLLVNPITCELTYISNKLVKIITC